MAAESMTSPGSATIDLMTAPEASRRRWGNPALFWPGLGAATAHLDAPVAVLELDALRANAHDMLARAAGTPIRVASKSVRVRAVIDAALALPGFHGVLAYTLDEALWLASGDADHAPIDDIVLGYPTADRSALRRLGASGEFASRVTLMVDSVEHLDFIDAVVPPEKRESIRVAIELDTAWMGPVGRIGVYRSPVHSPSQASALAAHIVVRPGFTLVGMMAYEAQIAGQGDAPRGRPAYAATVRWMQRNSKAELLERRAAAVAAVRRIADLEFVNGGGTGSLEFTSADPSVTEIGAGSGLLGGHLFDNYRSFSPAPAASFALEVVRNAEKGSATILGGGWVASGPPAVDRLPAVAWPTGLKMAPREMAGEVQTPVSGPNASGLRVGDRVWFRHTKSGELSEHVNEFVLVAGGEVIGSVPTYRGEGKAFL
ncbi:amino acid deaminase/aldolase [Planctomonas sp. JC2975]|uniref:alanine racemase n=1 Tax=Planctomonas sp. JC2975 TaxID=2729626 RepID=UPI00182C4637|nr:alanine racemase [Planctomonas sp. JC2975]NNC11274.1 amino acid deaminase/aldolase [Planctomonas sp. JC2975]